MFSSAIDADTQEAFLQTEYKVLGAAPFTLLIGVHSPALAAAHGAHHVACSAYFTAHNPWSQALPEPENAERQAELRCELTRRGLPFIEGVGQHPSNGWPGEASLLVLGLELEAGKALGRRWDQNAIVWSGGDAVPQMILLR